MRVSLIERVFAIELAKGDEYDTSRFGDEVASKTEWRPLARGGASFCTHRLRPTSSTRFDFKPTVGAIAFASLFCGLGVFSLLIAVPLALSGNFEGVFIGLIGALFTLGGGFLLRTVYRSIVFDLAERSFRRGDEHCELGVAHALQIIPEKIRSGRRSYWSFELNVVKKDGGRVLVVDHGGLEAIRADARTLSEALGIPVWDATVGH